jgi:hypothetical protein
MNAHEIEGKLIQQTGSLRCDAGGASQADLDLVRQLLAESPGGASPPERDAAALQPAAEAIDFVSLLSASSMPDVLDEELVAAFKGAAERAAQAQTVESKFTRPSSRVVRRTSPVRNSTLLGSVPAGVAALRAERSIGPFFDDLNRRYWFDVFATAQLTGVVRAPETAPFMLVPLPSMIVASSTTFALSAGTVWIQAALFAASAPAGAYCGVRIKRGKLRLGSPASMTSGNLDLQPAARAVLELELDPPRHDDPASGPGIDASRCSVELPAHVVLEILPGTARLVSATSAHAEIYGSSLSFEHESGPAEYDPLIDRVVLPLRAVVTNADTAGRYAIRSARSALYQPSGEAPLTGGGWALPLAVADPGSLGEAAGAGALLVRVGRGLRCSYRGLEGGEIRLLSAELMVEPNRLLVASSDAGNARARTELLLWQEGSDSQRRSEFQLRGKRRFTLRFVSERKNAEALAVEGSADVAIDRPLLADGRRIPLRAFDALCLFGQDATGFTIAGVAFATPASTGIKTLALALSNGLIRVGGLPVLLLSGTMSDERSVQDGALTALFRPLALTPALRDPYVTDAVLRSIFDVADFPAAARAWLVAAVRWPSPQEPSLRLSIPGDAVLPLAGMSPSGAIAATPDQGLGESAAAKIIEDAGKLNELRAAFEDAAGGGFAAVSMLDVSSNVDQLGVELSVETRRGAVGGAHWRISGIDLICAGHDVRIFTLPQVQWEPVTTIQNPALGFVFPSPLWSANDGGRTRIGANSVTLVPVAPDVVMKQMLAEFDAPQASRPVAASFTLPFGMHALARFFQVGSSEPGSTLAPNRPQTPDGSFTGGWQITALAHDRVPFPPKPLPPRTVTGTTSSVVSNSAFDFSAFGLLNPLEPFAPAFETLESASFPGAAWQTRNGATFTGTPLGLSVLSGRPGIRGVDDMFNAEMGPDGIHPRVPLTRIDFCGYGASCFSDWYNPNAVSSVSQVRFAVLVGRTRYEVVQVASILYPWGVPVVRTITVERTRDALITRSDSGWVASGPGSYRYPQPEPGLSIPPDWRRPIVTHPGVVRSVRNVRRIRETGRQVLRNDLLVDGSESFVVALSEVRFDGDFDVEGVVAGTGADGLVPSVDQIGFVQTSPVGFAIPSDQVAEALRDDWPIGGAVECAIDIGDSGQLMRVKRVEVGTAPGAGGAMQFAAVGRGALALPGDASWSVVRHDLAMPEPQSVSRDTGVPLIRQGAADGTGISPWYRIADPADLLRESTPVADYALLQASAGHRALFPRPRIAAGQRSSAVRTISSTQFALLADPYANVMSEGCFPPSAACFTAPNPYELEIRSDKRFRILPDGAIEFTVPGALAQRTLVDTGAFKIHARYDTAPGQTTLVLDPTRPVPWSVRVGGMSTVMDLGPVPELFGFRNDLVVSAAQQPTFANPESLYAPVLAPVVAVLSFLNELISGADPFRVATSNKPKIAATLEVKIADPNSVGNYIDLGGFKCKGSLGAGIGNHAGVLSDAEALPPGDRPPDLGSALPEGRWYGYFWVGLGLQVLIFPPIFGEGEAKILMRGTEGQGQEAVVRLTFGLNIATPRPLGPFKASVKFFYGLEVIFGGGGGQIGVLVGIAGTVDVGFLSVTVKVELMGGVTHLTSPVRNELVAQGTLAFEISICWFVTITVERSIEHRQELHL